MHRIADDVFRRQCGHPEEWLIDEEAMFDKGMALYELHWRKRSSFMEKFILIGFK